MTDTTTEETPKAELTPEQQAQRLISRAVARALARIEGGSKEELKKRWTEDRKKYVADGKKLAKALAKQGVTLTHDGKTEDAED